MIKFIGDIHGAITEFSNISKRYEEDLTCVIQIGDFGFYPKILKKWKPLDVPVYAIDGNHEFFPMLAEHMRSDERKPIEIADNLFYVPRGTIIMIDNAKIGFMGGAGSVDYKYRRKFMDWFPEEQINDGDMKHFDGVTDLDILVTHTPPNSIIAKHFNSDDLVNYFDLPKTWVDPSAMKIEILYNQNPNAKLICGHMHRPVIDGRVRILNVAEKINVTFAKSPISIYGFGV